MPDPIAVETARLRLRQWRAADRAPFAALNADPKVMAHFPAPLSRTASDALADRCELLIAERGWGLWAVEYKASEQFIGFVGLHIPTVKLPCSPCVEVGWRLAFQHWGCGFASEAAREVLRVGFERLELPEIVSFTSVLNRRSRAVMQRIGMLDTSVTFEHPSLPAGSQLRKHCLYHLTQTNWRKTIGQA
jgi:RimJ/RimL family protein N-acetyltransferase